MIGRPKCALCINRTNKTANPYEWKCKAFPNGIPEKKVMFITRDLCVDCNNGIGFVPNEELNK